MPTFQIGLAMAGAISAGAYSAGVFDFLVEALDEWRKAKRAGQGGLPQHDVAIKAISGASAGSIVAALGAIALADGISPRDDLPSCLGIGDDPRFNRRRCVLPGLYDAWVTRPRMTPATDGEPALLSVEDLSGAGASTAASAGASARATARAGAQGPLVSVLNAVLLDAISDRAIAPRPAAPGPVSHPFIADQLHLFLMLGNLHGVPYEISFQSVDVQGKSKPATHSMLMHGDRAHFRVEGLGSGAVPPSDWANYGTPTIINMASLFTGAAQPSAEWRHYGQAAVASAAFPVGLRARGLEIEKLTYDYRAWPIPIEPNVKISPSEAWHTGDTIYRFLSVDGGTINNEPFEFARWALLANPNAENPHNARDGKHADRAVIMVDPFPEGPPFEFSMAESPAIRMVLSRMIGMYVNQARFKLEELAAASAATVFSRFLIAPRRSAAGHAVDGQAAIACGLLGGFGGFIDEKFRAHDYQLGRRNCQNFLRHAFAVPVTNLPLGLADGGAASIERQFITNDETGQQFVPLIPLVGTAAQEVPAPKWQKISAWDLAALRPHLSRRANAVAVQALREMVKNPIMRAALRLLWCACGRGRVVNIVMQAIEDDLKARGQLRSVWQTARSEAT